VPKWISEAYVMEKRLYPIAAIFVFACTFVVTLGSKKSDNTNRVITTAKIILVIFMVVISRLH
jgi:amino acid transporter